MILIYYGTLQMLYNTTLPWTQVNGEGKASLFRCTVSNTSGLLYVHLASDSKNQTYTTKILSRNAEFLLELDHETLLISQPDRRIQFNKQWHHCRKWQKLGIKLLLLNFVVSVKLICSKNWIFCQPLANFWERFGERNGKLISLLNTKNTSLVLT